MRALVFNAPGVMELEDRPTPTAGPGEAVVDVTAAGICGSDLHGFTGASGRRSPGIVMGHEVAGTVRAVDPGHDPVMTGRKVVVFPLLTCGTCRWCRSGAEQLCGERSYVGIGRDGGFADSLLVPLASLVAIPDGLDPVVACLAEPAAVATHAVRRAPPLDGASVLVTGAGPIGLLLARAAAAAGAASVVNTEISGARRVAAAELGLATVDPTDEGWLDALRTETDGGVDVVFEAVGIQPTVEAALGAVRTRATVVLAAGWQTVSLPLGSLVTRELETRGTFNFSRAEFEDALIFLTTIDAAPLVTDRVPLAGAAAAFERLAADQGASVKTVVIP
jgi:2-desacetyl-2-hydroxyethyl bacteriochlorophyllide A dehydrogenase